MSEQSPFDIDPNRLDRELISQPRMSAAAGRAEAEARLNHARAKSRLEMVKARVRLSVRADPVAHDLGPKPTVDDVEAAVVVSTQYQEAEAAVIAAKFEADVAAGDTVAYLDRRKAVEGLIELLALDYYAGREVTPHRGGPRDAADELRKRSRYTPPGE